MDLWPTTLIIIDEVCRATSRKDMFAFAFPVAIIYHLLKLSYELTIYTTHFHMLRALSQTKQMISNVYSKSVAQTENLNYDHITLQYREEHEAGFLNS